MKTLLLFIFILLGLNLSAKKFVPSKIVHDPTSVQAIMYSKTDINGNKCALLIIRTDLTDIDLIFDTRMGITERKKKSNNEIWLYISPGEKSLEISAPNFMPASIIFSEKINSSSVYYLELDSDDQPLRTVEGKGGISINTNPEGAIVLIDGLGMADLNKHTPFSMSDVNALEYKITLTKNRFFALDTIMTVEAGKNSSYFFNLEPKFSDVTITSEPSGAIVTIEGDEKGRTPLELNGELLGLLHGEHNIKIVHEDCYQFNKAIVINPNEENIFHFELSEINGTISVRTIPDGANVRIDGEFLGITPIHKNKINTGSKIIEIDKEGYSSVRYKRKVIENEQVFFNDTLTEVGDMQINTKPEGAQFFFNGKYMGMTPVRIKTALGVHEFKFVKKDYVVQFVQEDIKGDIVKKLKFEYKLDLEQYEIQVFSEPDSVNVYVRGELKGVTPCKIYLPNEKTKIKFEKAKYISSTKKLKPGDTDFVLNGELRKTVKEIQTVGFCFERWDPKDYKARFDIGNLAIFKFGWNNFENDVIFNNISFKGIGSATFEFSPTFPVTRYGEISPFGGIGYEAGIRSDTLNYIDNMFNPAISSVYYSFGSYFYVNIINNLQVYLQLAWLNQINDVKFNEDDFSNIPDQEKNWDNIFKGRYGFRTAFGIRIRLGGT